MIWGCTEVMNSKLHASTFSSMLSPVCSCIVNQNLISWASPDPEASQKSSPAKQKLIQRGITLHCIN